MWGRQYSLDLVHSAKNIEKNIILSGIYISIYQLKTWMHGSMPTEIIRKPELF